MDSFNLLIVTGASKGLGKAMCEAFSRLLRGSLHIVLSGRCVDELHSVAAGVKTLRGDNETVVEIFPYDFELGRDMPSIAHALFHQHTSRAYKRIIFVNNAGTVTPIGVAGSAIPYADFEVAFQVNAAASCFLSSEFVRFYKSLSPSPRADIVNVTSLNAVAASPSFGVYCAGKGAREMYHNTIALENKDTSLKVLNYAPGPCDTNMQTLIRNCDTTDHELRNTFIAMKSENTLVSPQATSMKCANIVLGDLFKSGDHIDYYDSIAGIDVPINTPSTCCSCTYCTCVDCKCREKKIPECDPCVAFTISKTALEK